MNSLMQRLLIQKKIYLTQLTGLDLGHRFSWHIHGPYCRELTSDAFQLVEAIENDESIPVDRPLNPLAKQFVGKAKTTGILAKGNHAERLARASRILALPQTHRVLAWRGAASRVR